jgi:ABC-type methionine transport system permease subunit
MFLISLVLVFICGGISLSISYDVNSFRNKIIYWIISSIVLLVIISLPFIIS